MKKMDIIDKYLEVAKKILKSKYEEFGIPFMEDMGHLVHLGSSVMLTRDKIMEGGGFVKAVVNNDLYRAYTLADNTAIRGIKYFLHLIEYVHFDENGNFLDPETIN